MDSQSPVSDEASREEQRGRQRLPRNVKLLGAASLLNDVASEMIFPLLPLFLISILGGSRFYLGLVEGVADSASSLIKLLTGAWSDRVKRRKGFVVFGYALAGAARPLIGLAVYPWHLLAARAGDRIGKGVRTSPRDAMIADSTAPQIRGRAFGFHRAMDHLGAAIGPLLAFALLRYWSGESEKLLRTLFLVTAVPGLLVMLLLIFGLRERSVPAKPDGPPRPHPARGVFRPGFRLYLVALVIFTLGNSSDAFLLVRAEELGVSEAMLPLLWCAFHVVKSGGNLLAGRAVDRLGSRALIVGGWLLYAAIYMAFAAAENAWQIWAVFLTYGVYYALTEPAEKTLVATMVGHGKTGLAFGWFNFATAIAALPASIVFGWLYQRWGAVVAFGWGAGLALLAAALLAFVKPLSDASAEAGP